jgi:hypothetical protein
MSQLNLHFVISAPRSGSTWLATALNHHPQLFATEHRLFGRFCEVWRNNDGTTAPRITFDSYARAFGMHYFYPFMGLNYEQFVETFQYEFAQFLVEFAARRTGKPFVIDKITPYPGTARLVVKQIRKLFPESKLIQLVRDGRDVLTSGAFDWLLKDASGTPRHDFFVNPQPGKRLTRFFDDAVIERWALNWLETVDVFSASNSAMSGPAASPSMQIRYESMKSDLAAQLQRLFKELGVDDSQSVAANCEQQASFRKMAGREAGVADPFAKARKGMVGDWRNYFTRTDGELFVKWAGRGLVDMGYEADDGWVKQLPDQLDLICE